jgi:hypothetical protein
MLTKRATIFFVLFFAAIVQASAQELPTPPVFAIVASGERTRVGTAFHLNPDCSSGGKITVRVVDNPNKGIAEVVDERGFTSYAKDTQTYKCNERESQITAIYYKSMDGFKGKDRFTVEMFFANGSYRKRVFNVDVR